MKCNCGEERFAAHQICRHDVTVDADGNWIEDCGVYDSEKPYGPFTCMTCGKEMDELP